ncbi:uncharacterized protein TNCV_1966101 [Trichonephila clavipes]|nr:uncharacterized protein TNCV_1966101 [Trichonephila clavipes]
MRTTTSFFLLADNAFAPPSRDTEEEPLVWCDSLFTSSVWVSSNLDLILPIHKHNSFLAELLSVALATIHERYPDHDWLHVFTDGSSTTSFNKAGAGSFSNSFNLDRIWLKSIPIKT